MTGIDQHERDLNVVFVDPKGRLAEDTRPVASTEDRTRVICFSDRRGRPSGLLDPFEIKEAS